jgi:hypothetical protein
VSDAGPGHLTTIASRVVVIRASLQVVNNDDESQSMFSMSSKPTEQQSCVSGFAGCHLAMKRVK